MLTVIDSVPAVDAADFCDASIFEPRLRSVISVAIEDSPVPKDEKDEAFPKAGNETRRSPPMLVVVLVVSEVANAVLV
jgi:hypothetical protein